MCCCTEDEKGSIAFASERLQMTSFSTEFRSDVASRLPKFESSSRGFVSADITPSVSGEALLHGSLARNSTPLLCPKKNAESRLTSRIS